MSAIPKGKIILLEDKTTPINESSLFYHLVILLFLTLNINNIKKII